MPRQLRSWSQLLRWMLHRFLMNYVTFLANTNNFRETFHYIFKGLEQWNTTRTDYRAKFSTDWRSEHLILQLGKAKQLYISNTHINQGTGDLFWALHFHNSTLSSKGSRDLEIHLFSNTRKKQVKKKQTISVFLFALIYHRYCSSFPASPSSSSADNPEDFKKLPSQKLPIYQGKYK